MRSTRFLFVTALLAPALVANDAPGNPQETLDQARAKIQLMAHRLENYACIETVDRNYFERVTPDTTASVAVAPRPSCNQVRAESSSSGALKLEATDRLRLEITMSEDREIHSWPGATRFDVRAVDEIIREGPIGTGAFGAYLLGIFDNPGVDFQYVGPSAAGSSPALEYHYRVPREVSRYRVKTGAAWTIVAYEGSFWLDAQSLALDRLTVRTDDPSSGASVCEAAATLDYHSVHVGSSDVMLPRQGQLEIVMRDRRQTTNTTTFSGCREYRTESALRFDDRADADDPVARPLVRTPVALPIGLPIVLALGSPIDTDTAAAGDPVIAKVVKPVRRPGSNEIVIPAGAGVRGRITRVEHHLVPRPYFLIAISFNRLEERDLSSPFAAKLDGNAELARELGADLTVRERGLAFWDIGIFLFPTNKSRYVLPAGYESKWLTLATPAR